MKLNKMREQMSEAFINSLKEDKIPWHQEWSTVASRPYNAVSDAKYRGNNAFWLAWTAQAKGYDDPRWCTFKQAQENEWKIKKGEKGTPIEFWSLYDIEEKRKINQAESRQLMDELGLDFFKRVKPISSTYYVFNAAQMDGVPELDITTYQLNTEELISCRDKLISNMEVEFGEGGDRASYSPGMDKISMPPIERFESEYAYMSTFLHEAAHATGAEKRLNRAMLNTFGTPEYAREELRAEIASAFTAQLTGIQYKHEELMENHKAYIQSWIKTLENNPNELFSAINDAEKISDYLIEKGEFDIQINASKENQAIINEAETQSDDGVVVKTNMGEIPVEDYREIVAGQHGFDSYEEMYEEGLRIGNGYDADPKQEKVLKSIEELKKKFVWETGEDLSLWQLGQISREQIKEMLSNGNTQELELAINELGEAGLGRTEKLRLETLDSVRSFNDSRIVIQNAEKNIDYFPDPKVSIDDMYKYGYTYSEMLPVGKEKAMELQEHGIEIFKLYPDNTETSMEGRSVEHDQDEVMYGIEKESWDRHLSKINEVNMVQDIATAERLLNLQEEQRITEWFGDYNMHEAKLGVSSEQIQSKYEEYSKLIDAYKKIEGIKLSNIAIDEDNYIHFTVQTGDYEYDGLYCIHDMNNGPDNKLVSIEHGNKNKIFEQQWENIENFFKEYSAPRYSEMQKHDISLLRGAQAARLRMALKGSASSKESYFNDNIPEDVKYLAYRVGKEAMDYMNAGMDIKDVITYKTSVIDEKLGVNDCMYTKNLLCSAFATTNLEYRDYMNNLYVANKDNMMLLSEGLASRILDTGITVYTIDDGEMKAIKSRLDFKQREATDFFVDKNLFANIPHEIYPVVKCEWSEHPAFDGGKTYMVSEFDKIMADKDKEWSEGYARTLEKYGSVEDLYNTDVTEDQRYLGYAKVKFDVTLDEGLGVTDRQDIGDGEGGLLEHFKKYPDLDTFSDELREGVKRESEFNEHINKLMKVYDYENIKEMPEEFRVTTPDIECISKSMLDKQYELISNMPEYKNEPIMSLKDFALADKETIARKFSRGIGR